MLLLYYKFHPIKPESPVYSDECCAAVGMTPPGQSGCVGYPDSPAGPGTAP